MDAALAQISECVRDAAARHAALRITGAGTKAFHPDSRADRDAQALDMRALAGVVSYEPSELVITVRAGTPLAEVEELLAGHGQCLAFEPPRFAAGGTVGGMVAAGLSGPARASVGAVRDFVLGVEIINGRGELLRFGGQVMKNVAGYDVSRLMAGSWGRLAAITEVSLKVLPFAPAEATLRFDCGQAEALARLNAWGGQPLPLNASCWVEEGGTGQLYVRLRGAQAAVQAACRGMGGELQNAPHVPQDWLDCRDQRLPWFAGRAPQLALWRLSLPQTAPVLLLPAGVADPLVEWHGALRWVQAAPEHGPQLAALARQAGGSASLFIAADADGAGATGIFDIENPALAAIHQRLSQAFDPAGVFGAGTGG
ncbi:glycolate oxidase subunit GlcE [Pulveribacter sp.]|uniref:glycolate oxidase subunit GlcE n=1 Tax=Pulveribacter sp. TaxID=2678893 RepID=UPI0028AA8E5C|nr:glycolate oxidase subunit GlcE [Pulveribacter sp.]